jgi:mono/diheme cytochrome c family protein
MAWSSHNGQYKSIKQQGRACMKITVMSLLAVMLLGSWVTAQTEGPTVHRGATLYKQHCLRCHGMSGEGNGPDSKLLIVPPANFQSIETRLKPEWEMLSIIKYGIIFSSMHGWQNRLSDEEMLDVVKYIRELGSLEPH